MLAVLLTAPLMANSTQNKDKAETEAAIKALELDIQQTNDLLKSLNKQRTSTQSRIQQSDQAINQLQSEITALEKKLKEGQGEVKKLQRRQQALAAKTDQQKQQIARNLKSIYMSSNDSRLKLLLNQENPEDVSRQLAYLDYIQNAQLQTIDQFEQDIRALTAIEQKQQALVTRLSTEKVALNQKKSTLENRQSEHQALLVQLNKKQKDRRYELSQMQKQRDKLTEVLAQIISQQMVGSTPFQDMRGKMPRPLSGKVLYGYNQQRPDTRLRWPGIFITSQAGLPVKAVHEGRVIFSNWMRGYGLLTIVDHGDGYLTLYANTQSVLKKEGETVLAGEPLAMSGQSGGQLKPGVYFEIRKKGVPVSPEQWLKSH